MLAYFKRCQFIIIPIVIFVVTILVRMFHITHSSLDLDDAYSIFYSHASWSHLTELFNRDINPPTYFVVLHFWIKVFGESVFTVRLLSVVFSALTAVYIWKFAKSYLNLFVAYIALMLFLFSPFQLILGLYVRSFTMCQFFTVLSFYYFFGIIKTGSIRNTIYYALTTVVLLNVHQVTFVAPLVQFCLLLIFWPKKSIFYKVILAQFVVLLSLIPQLLLFSENKGDSLNAWRTAPSIDEGINVFQSLLGGEVLFLMILVVLLAGLIFAKVTKLKSFKKEKTLLFCWSIIGLLIAFVCSQKVPFFLPKYLSYFTPGIYLLVAVLLYGFYQKSKILAVSIALAFFVCGILSLNFNYGKSENWKKVAPMAKHINNKGFDVLVSPVYMQLPFTYYFDKAIFNKVDSIPQEMYNQHFAYFTNGVDQNLFAYRKPDKLLFIQAHPGYIDPKRNNIIELNKIYTYSKMIKVGAIELHLYQN